MRLICPNCDAQYEVSAEAIPETGRDVQCSACGHTWFQPPMTAAPVPEIVAVPVVPPVAEITPDAPVPTAEAALADTDAEIVAAMGAALASFDPPLPEDLPDDAAEEVAVAAVAPPPEQAPVPRPAPAARSLDDTMMAVLREEAEREVRARAHDEPVIEIQQDLALEAATAAVVPRRVVPFDRPASGGEVEARLRPQAKGRELLPDIEEINSTLSPMTNPVADGLHLAGTAPRRGSFGRGFMLMILLGMIALTVYVTAPRIAQRFPAAAAPVNAYVGGVDSLRVKLDGLMESATSALQN